MAADLQGVSPHPPLSRRQWECSLGRTFPRSHRQEAEGLEFEPGLWPLPPNKDSGWRVQGLLPRLHGDTEQVGHASSKHYMPCCTSLLHVVGSSRSSHPCSPLSAPASHCLDEQTEATKVIQDSLGAPPLVSSRAWTQPADANVLPPNHSTTQVRGSSVTEAG